MLGAMQLNVGKQSHLTQKCGIEYQHNKRKGKQKLWSQDCRHFVHNDHDFKLHELQPRIPTRSEKAGLGLSARVTGTYKCQAISVAPQKLLSIRATFRQPHFVLSF